MFVFLSKLLPLFVYPQGMICVLLVFSLVVYKKRRLSTAAIGLAVAILWICGTPWLPNTLARSLEWRYLPQENIPTEDVIVVLGGGTESADYPRSTSEVNGAGDRVLYAARLYKEGKAPNILLSGGNLNFATDRGTTPAAEMADILELTGIPEEALWLQPKSQNTAEDAQYSAEILNEKGIHTIILVTSAMHMPRAVALFEAQGFEVIPAPTDYGITEKSWESLMTFNLESQILNLVPSTGNLGLTATAMKEYIGMFVYHLRGWM